MSETGGLPPVSVIVASRRRAGWLERCLSGLSRLDYPEFEIVIVADDNSLAETFHIAQSLRCKTIHFEAAALSRARNAGISASSGEIVAFIDDDSVPEPLWLHHLVSGLEATRADAAVGFVRGRNGISFQSRAAAIDAEAETHNLDWLGEDPTVPDIPAGRALKLVGTNMAFRRNCLVELGGFDPLLDYFLDDSDLSLRLANSNHLATVVPLAEVHHAFAASERRTRLRSPLRLFDIGRSTAIFLRRHGCKDLSRILRRVTIRERRRLLNHMVSGLCEPKDVGLLLDDLAAGWRAGLDITFGPSESIARPNVEFLPCRRDLTGQRTFASRLARRSSTIKSAKTTAQAVRTVSVFSFSLTPIRHRVRYENGVWIQTGGLFGRSDRSGPRVRWSSFTKRVRREVSRVAKQRGIGDIGKRRDTESLRID